MDKLARLGRSLPSAQLRVGVVVDTFKIEAWKRPVLDALRAEPAFSIEAVFALGASRDGRPPWAYSKWVQWSSEGGDPEQLIDSASDDPTPPTIVSSDSTGLSQEISGRIGAQGLDVLIWLAEGTSHEDCAGLARYGVWRFSLGDPSQPRVKPAYFSAAYRGDLVSELWLLCHQQGFDTAAVLERYCAPTQQGWDITRNAAAPLKAAAPMIVRRLLDLLEFGSQYFFQRLSRCETVGCSKAPASSCGTWTLGCYLSRQAFRSLKFRFEDRGRQMRWFNAIRTDRDNFTRMQDTFVAAGLREIVPERGSQEADPFLIEWRGRHFLFYEQIPQQSGRGCIACREIGPELSLSEPVRVIERPYHMSYPFLIKHAGAIFMLPETSANRTLELYRATDFPYQWRLERVLLRDVGLVDTTPFLLDGTWYFFTTASETGETLLFHADDLDGEWRYHRQNPICSDVRRARGAGALFYRRGKLIRPAQDCSVRYGYAIALNEITELSKLDYAERLVETILPAWEKGLLGTHTVNASESFEVLDGLRLQ